MLMINVGNGKKVTIIHFSLIATQITLKKQILADQIAG